MYTLFVILTLVVCVLLVLVVLAQAAKGNGLAGGLAAPGSVGSTFGVRRATDFLMKSTMYLAGAFMLLTLIISLFLVPRSASTVNDAIQQGPTGATALPTPAQPQQQPASQAPGQQAPLAK